MILFYFAVNCDAAVDLPFEDKCRVHGGLWACSDCEKCTSLADCNYDDAKWRSGFYCHEWPYFNRVRWMCIYT